MVIGTHTAACSVEKLTWHLGMAILEILIDPQRLAMYSPHISPTYQIMWRLGVLDITPGGLGQFRAWRYKDKLVEKVKM